MKKSDLRIGYLVQIRSGEHLMVMPDSEQDGNLILAGYSDYIKLSNYRDDLRVEASNCEKFDIIRVYGRTNNNRALLLNPIYYDLIWERKEELKEESPGSEIMLNSFAKDVHENAKAHGWYDEPRRFGEIVALCHSELSEALEEYRKNMPLVYFVDETADTDGGIETDLSRYNGQKLEGIATEMIDCIIRILDWCGRENIDVEWLLAKKHEYNKTRPYKHGGKII